jgi:hypothetical protein
MSEIKTGVVQEVNLKLKTALIKLDDGSGNIPIWPYHFKNNAIERLVKGMSVMLSIDVSRNVKNITKIEIIEQACV